MIIESQVKNSSSVFPDIQISIYSNLEFMIPTNTFRELEEIRHCAHRLKDKLITIWCKKLSSPKAPCVEHFLSLKSNHLDKTQDFSHT